MGLMTNPKAKEVISSFVLRLYVPLSILLYIAAIAVMIGLSTRPFNAGTYFSENALLPGLVDKGYRGSSDVDKFLKLLQEVTHHTDAIPSKFIKDQFSEIGLEAFDQNFTAIHPFLKADEKISGTNVYAILRAPRTAGTEAMVFMVPYHVKRDLGQESVVNVGVALMLSIAKYFVDKTYWSKDVIFLVVDQEEVGAQAWIEGYYDISREFIISSELHGRSGAILGAVNLELPTKTISHIDVKIEGLNGQLPNLDLFNLVVRLCNAERLGATFHDRRDPRGVQELDIDGIRHTTETMMLNMLHQASGKPNGIHGLFLRYGIQALTLQGKESSYQRKGDKVREVGLVIEGTFRSINNILERFHQSFFFYVLPQTSRYVSIGMYMISLGMLLVVPTLNGLALWFQTASENGKVIVENRPHHQVIPIIITSHLAGALIYFSPEFCVTRIRSYFGLEEMEALQIGLTAILFGCIFIPLSQRSKVTNDWVLLKCYALVWQAITLLAISMMNFSLSFIIALLTIPVYIIARPFQNILLRLLIKLALILVSPPAILFNTVLFYLINFQFKTTSLDTLYSAGLISLDAVSQSIIDQYLFDNWSFVLGSLVLFPSWFLMWICSSR